MLSDSIRKFIIVFCAVVVALSSCTREALPGVDTPVPESAPARALFSLAVPDEGTRSTGSSSESAVSRWAVFLYDGSGDLAGYGSSSSLASISQIVEPGTYTVCVAVNYPVSGTGAMTPSSMTTLSSLTGYTVWLASQTPASLTMYGSRTVTLTAGDNGTVSVSVERHAVKVGIQKITCEMDYASDAAKTFILKGVYVTNVYYASRWGADYGSLSSTQSCWYNTMGWATSGGCTSPAVSGDILGTRSLSVRVRDGSSYTTEHFFYIMPNPVTADDNSSTWGPRKTRLVIEATLDGTTYYYVKTIPPLSRNYAYIITEAVIHGRGSTDSEEDTTDSLEVTFTTSIAPWTDYGLSESS